MITIEAMALRRAADSGVPKGEGAMTRRRRGYAAAKAAFDYATAAVLLVKMIGCEK